MAVYTYGANNITFSSFETWSNNITTSLNIELDVAVNDFHPANAAPFQVSEFAPNTSIFYGNIIAGTGGTVAISAPYTVGATTSITVKNFLISTYSLTIVASATYPYTFNSWRSAASGGGSQLSTSSTLTLNYLDHTSVPSFYAYFTTTHISP